MKLILILLLAIAGNVYGQQPLRLATDKTTALIFPFPIRHVDRGTKDVIVQPVKDDDKILLVKAGSKQFAETSLSVITTDGHVYSFVVNYTDRPDTLVRELPVFTHAGIETYARSIADNQPLIHRVSDSYWSMKMALLGTYVRGDVLYFQFQLTNSSAIDFDVEVLRFYIRDRKKSKRTATQEIDCTPLFISGNPKSIKAFSSSTIVVALNKFTIPDAKLFRVQIMEKGGGRHLTLTINNKIIIHSKTLPDLY